MKITKQKLKEIIKEEIESTIDEKAELKIPVERYDAFKRKIEQWGMLFNKFTAYTRDIHRQDWDRKTDGKRVARMAGKLEREFRKIMDEFDFEAKVYDDERYAMRQKLDQFDGGSEFFMEEEVIEEVEEKTGEEFKKQHQGPDNLRKYFQENTKISEYLYNKFLNVLKKA